MSKKIVIVGAGYGGTEVIRQMVLRGVRNAEIELISNRTHFENTIGGTELISEKAKPEELKYDLKELSGYWGFELTLGKAENIDLSARTIGVGSKQKDYDILVLATGSEPNFYNVKGAEFATPAYRLSHFRVLNERLREFSHTPDVVVAGAGYVGLECVAEVLDLFRAIGKRARITIVEKMDSALPTYNNVSARRIAYEYFTSRGAKFSLGKAVKEVEKDRVILEDGSSVESNLTIWTAGVTGCIVPLQVPELNLYRGCIRVNERLLIEGREDAFALGDVASVKVNGKEATKMAGEALEQAKTVARNLSLVVAGQKPHVSHVPNYTTDYPKALLSLGEGKAMLIFGPDYVSTGTTEYFLKKRIDFQEMMERFPQ